MEKKSLIEKRFTKKEIQDIISFSMKHFILMGDIIASGDKNQSLLMHDFKSLIQQVNNDHKKGILSPLTITLGDEFQGIIENLATSIAIILNIEETIIKNKLNFKLRYILHQGEIETPINKIIAHEMLGSGLTNARYRLNELKNTKERFVIAIENKLQESILINAFKIYSHIVEKWNVEKDYEIASNFIQYHDYKIVSEIMNKNRSLLWKREKTLNIDSYNSAKSIIQTISLIT
ncbi:SatD family protein [Flavobacterium granuli]|uniref:SatD family (SatD) n=1 Tax=Flavobacterium granuli TaxID=280093 RepID=A0A1M5NWS8_9FLAO|nr:SatD family protein [Flavobacterium granuli]PRZ23423.1 SatD family protein [Flavobacterium granuli]SHG93915.1 SatD family (SatD) [Flavobacterium granuli]